MTTLRPADRFAPAFGAPYGGAGDCGASSSGGRPAEAFDVPADRH